MKRMLIITIVIVVTTKVIAQKPRVLRGAESPGLPRARRCYAAAGGERVPQRESFRFPSCHSLSIYLCVYIYKYIYNYVCIYIYIYIYIGSKLYTHTI